MMRLNRFSYVATIFCILAGGIEARKCPSFCTTDAKGCKTSGGKVVGYCVNGLACCDLSAKETGSCGDTKSGLLKADFVSPHYPAYQKGDLLCNFGFTFLETAIGIKLEFLEITMDGLGFAGHGGGCDSDMIFFKGFKTWTPKPLCGNLTGYSTVIERDHGDIRMDKINIVAFMSSQSYRWKIRLTQILAPVSPKSVVGAGLLSPLAKRFREAHRRSAAGREKSAGGPVNQIPIPFRLYRGQPPIDNNGISVDDDDGLEQTFLFTDPQEGIFDDELDDLGTPFIVRGSDADITEVPWQVSIRLRYVPVNKNGTNATDSGDEDEDEVEDDEGNEVGVSALMGNFSSSSNDTEQLDFIRANGTTKPTAPPKRNCSIEEGHHYCGGSIIASRFILTAAHCFHGSTKMHSMEYLPYLKVVVGDTDSCTRDLESHGSKRLWNLTQEEYDIETVVIHYGYDDVALLNDVALIKLSKPLSFGENIRKIRLAKPGENFEGQEALASGWGLTNLTASGMLLPYILQSSPHFLIRNHSECNKESERLFGAPMMNVTAHRKYKHAFESVICTSTTNATREKLRGEVLVGPGDSGGPLVIQASSGDPVLIGIVSYGIPPENPQEEGEFIDFFQSVAFFHNWINLAMIA